MVQTRDRPLSGEASGLNKKVKEVSQVAEWKEEKGGKGETIDKPPPSFIARAISVEE